MLQEIQSDILTNQNAFIRPAPWSEASTRHFKKMSVFDGVNKNKYLGDIVGTLVSCLLSTIIPLHLSPKDCQENCKILEFFN